MSEQDRIGIDDLADRAGVSRRTVRYYVQEGLLPAPLGVGRGRHYDRSHLERLLQVKALQEAGQSLDDIRAALNGPADRVPQGVAALRLPAPPPASLPRSTWRRLELAPGVELHVSHDIRLPSPGRLEQLAAWCRTHLARPDAEEE